MSAQNLTHKAQSNTFNSNKKTTNQELPQSQMVQQSQQQQDNPYSFSGKFLSSKGFVELPKNINAKQVKVNENMNSRILGFRKNSSSNSSLTNSRNRVANSQAQQLSFPQPYAHANIQQNQTSHGFFQKRNSEQTKLSELGGGSSSNAINQTFSQSFNEGSRNLMVEQSHLATLNGDENYPTQNNNYLQHSVISPEVKQNRAHRKNLQNHSQLIGQRNNVNNSAMSTTLPNFHMSGGGGNAHLKASGSISSHKNQDQRVVRNLDNQRKNQQQKNNEDAFMPKRTFTTNFNNMSKESSSLPQTSLRQNSTISSSVNMIQNANHLQNQSMSLSFNTPGPSQTYYSTLTSRDVNDQGLQMLESRKQKKQSELELQEMENRLKVLELQEKKAHVRTELKNKLNQQYINIRVRSNQEQSERRRLILDRQLQEEAEKKERVQKLKEQWNQSMEEAKVHFQQSRHKQVQEIRNNQLMYQLEKDKETKKKDIKKFNINNSKIAQLYQISKDQYLRPNKIYHGFDSSVEVKSRTTSPAVDANFKQTLTGNCYQAEILINQEQALLNQKKVEQLRQLEEQMRLRLQFKKSNQIMEESRMAYNSQSSLQRSPVKSLHNQSFTHATSLSPLKQQVAAANHQGGSTINIQLQPLNNQFKKQPLQDRSSELKNQNISSSSGKEQKVAATVENKVNIGVSNLNNRSHQQISSNGSMNNGQKSARQMDQVNQQIVEDANHNIQIIPSNPYRYDQDEFHDYNNISQFQFIKQIKASKDIQVFIKRIFICLNQLEVLQIRKKDLD